MTCFTCVHLKIEGVIPTCAFAGKPISAATGVRKIRKKLTEAKAKTMKVEMSGQCVEAELCKREGSSP